MSFDEPHPEYRSPAIWPVWAAYAAAMVISWLLYALAHTSWGFLSFLVEIVVGARAFVLVVVRSRRFDRESDAWLKRMHAYYDRPLNARWN